MEIGTRHRAIAIASSREDIQLVFFGGCGWLVGLDGWYTGAECCVTPQYNTEGHDPRCMKQQEHSENKTDEKQINERKERNGEEREREEENESDGDDR